MRTLLDVAIERTYAAGMGDMPWSEALAALTRAHHAEQAILFSPDIAEHQGGLWESHDAHKLRRLAVAQPPHAALAAGHVDHLCTNIVADGSEAGVPSTLFALLRPDSATPFSDAERVAIDISCRHLAMAVRLWFRKRASRHGAEALASALGAAALIVDRELRIAWMNRLAETWTRAGKIGVANGQLAEIDGFDIDMARAVAEAIEGTSRVDVDNANDTTLEIAAVRLPGTESESPAGAGALLLVREHVVRADVACALMRNFNLTRSEADLALAIAAGKQALEVAAQRAVSPSTVRSQMKALLAKSGARRQSEVVSLVARMHPILAPRRAKGVNGHPG